jgi:hypothetical protein
MFAPAARTSRDARRTGVRQVAGPSSWGALVGGLADDAQRSVLAVDQSRRFGHVQSSGKEVEERHQREWRRARTRGAAR